MVKYKVTIQKYTLRYRNRSLEKQKNELWKPVTTYTFISLFYIQSIWKFLSKMHWQKKLFNCLNITFNTLTALTGCWYGFSLSGNEEDCEQIKSLITITICSHFLSVYTNKYAFSAFSAEAAHSSPAVLSKLPSTFPRKWITCRAAVRRTLLDAK